MNIKAPISRLGGIANALHNATPEEKAAVYRGLDIRGTYHPAKQQVRIEANLYPHLLDVSSSPHGEMVGVRGGT